ncbi:MAG TPA: hypothetical protein VGM89_10165, partial [Puia sp.]
AVFKTVTAILQPVSFTFLTFVIADAIRNRNSSATGRIVNLNFCILSIFLATFHTVIIAIILVEESIHHYPIESLTLYLGSAETFFGFGLGAIIRSLFDDAPPAQS